MKKLCGLFMLCALALLCSCSFSAEGGTSGLSITLPGTGRYAASDVSSYTVRLHSDSDDEILSYSGLSGQTITIESIPVGAYTVCVYGLDTGGHILVNGSVSAQVMSHVTTTVAMTVKTFSGCSTAMELRDVLDLAQSGDTIMLRANIIVSNAISGSGVTIDGNSAYGLEFTEEARFTNCTFQNGAGTNRWNQRFGMIYWNGSTAVFTNCTFRNNTTTGDVGGGALALFGHGTVTIRGCTFTGNDATHGGAIDIGGEDTVTLTNSTFQGNTNNCGEDVYLGGSGAFIRGSGNTSDASTPYQCYDSSKNAPGLFN